MRKTEECAWILVHSTIPRRPVLSESATTRAAPAQGTTASAQPGQQIEPMDLTTQGEKPDSDSVSDSVSDPDSDTEESLLPRLVEPRPRWDRLQRAARWVEKAIKAGCRAEVTWPTEDTNIERIMLQHLAFPNPYNERCPRNGCPLFDNPARHANICPTSNHNVLQKRHLFIDACLRSRSYGACVFSALLIDELPRIEHLLRSHVDTETMRHVLIYYAKIFDTTWRIHGHASYPHTRLSWARVLRLLEIEPSWGSSYLASWAATLLRFQIPGSQEAHDNCAVMLKLAASGWYDLPDMLILSNKILCSGFHGLFHLLVDVTDKDFERLRPLVGMWMERAVLGAARKWHKDYSRRGGEPVAFRDYYDILLKVTEMGMSTGLTEVPLCKAAERAFACILPCRSSPENVKIHHGHAGASSLDRSVALGQLTSRGPISAMKLLYRTGALSNATIHRMSLEHCFWNPQTSEYVYWAARSPRRLQDACVFVVSKALGCRKDREEKIHRLGLCPRFVRRLLYQDELRQADRFSDGGWSELDPPCLPGVNFSTTVCKGGPCQRGH